MTTITLKQMLGSALCGGALLLSAPVLAKDDAFEWPRLLVIGTPGTASGASGNQQKASESPPPQSKKKCWPPPKMSSVLMSGMPSTPS